MKIKVSKHRLNIHYRGSPWGRRTQQQAYCLRYAHSQHTESHLGKKQQQAKIPIAFLFSQLHFNNVTSYALFDGGHLVMRSKRCAVQNQGITLICNFYYLLFFFGRGGAVRGELGTLWSCENGEKRQSLRNIVNCQYNQLSSLLVARGVASP